MKDIAAYFVDCLNEGDFGDHPMAYTQEIFNNEPTGEDTEEKNEKTEENEREDLGDEEGQTGREMEVEMFFEGR